MKYSMTLLDVVKLLTEADRMLTVYVAKPWTPDSTAMFVWIPPDFDPPREICGLACFSDVSEIQHVMDAWIEREKPSLRQQCEALIEYLMKLDTIWDVSPR
jgi:hypothetical protein